MLEQRGTDLFLTKELALAVVEGQYNCSFIQKFPDSGKPGASSAAQLAVMTLIKAPDFQFAIGYELRKLRPAINVVKRVVLRDKALIAVVKPLLQESKTSG